MTQGVFSVYLNCLNCIIFLTFLMWVVLSLETLVPDLLERRVDLDSLLRLVDDPEFKLPLAKNSHVVTDSFYTQGITSCLDVFPSPNPLLFTIAKVRVTQLPETKQKSLTSKGLFYLWGFL